ncbi:HK97 family phage prohead protease [Streptomyces goshikiensis]|uniref:HK97 family phage prohead protease n=1 Tax=Streptomyces goshikiensis TaxID=1942 RepID=UPI002E158582|nr:HK97 family phage prohead protease [Streptomyces goshikiensis]WSR97776.1 HK97 family phage prohead protease [Streptomyces goshikiensis]
MLTKDAPARVKAAGESDGLGVGEFTALVSVFGNEDSVGDVVMPGAFADDLARWKQSGDPIPVIWSHDWGDPFSHIGHVTDARESAGGLLVTGQLDLDNPKAQQVFRLLKGRRVTQMSFAYDIEDGGWGERDGREVYELRKLRIHEVGPCLVGANQETELLAAKAHGLVRGTKAGRVLSQANYDSLSKAHAAIGEVLAAATPEKSKAEEPGQQESPAPDGSQPSEQPETRPAQELKAEPTPSSTEEESTPGPREASAEDAAKVGAAASRLLTRLDLDLIEIGA